jgi:mannitol/fructose-specific phosphotransferase system IIA component (Ntr-type)
VTDDSADAAAIAADDLEAESLPGRVLLLERKEGFLSRSLTAGGVLDVEAGSMVDLYQQLIAYVVQRNPGVSKVEMLRDTLEVAELVPAWLGHGIAIPHLYSSHLSHRICALARLQPPGLRVPDQGALRFVFFLVSPAGDPEGHLATLAEIARFCSDPKHREAMDALSAVADVERFVRTHSR